MKRFLKNGNNNETGLIENVKTKRDFKKIIVVIAILIATVLVAMSFQTSHPEGDQKVLEMCLKDIGELNTQEGIFTVIKDEEESRKLGKIKIPGTTSRMIFSYDVIVKAGYNFEELEVDYSDDKVKVKLPEAKIHDCYIDHDSLETHLDKSSLFSYISLDEKNAMEKEIIEEGRTKAINSGIYEIAEANAKTMIESKVREIVPEETEIVFV